MAHVCVIGLQGEALSFHPHLPPPPFPPGLTLNIFVKICWWNSKVLICKQTLKNLYLLLLSWFILVNWLSIQIAHKVWNEQKRSIKVISIYLIFFVKWNLRNDMYVQFWFLLRQKRSDIDKAQFSTRNGNLLYFCILLNYCKEKYEQISKICQKCDCPFSEN